VRPPIRPAQQRSVVGSKFAGRLPRPAGRRAEFPGGMPGENAGIFALAGRGAWIAAGPTPEPSTPIGGHDQEHLWQLPHLSRPNPVTESPWEREREVPTPSAGSTRSQTSSSHGVRSRDWPVRIRFPFSPASFTIWLPGHERRFRGGTTRVRNAANSHPATPRSTRDASGRFACPDEPPSAPLASLATPASLASLASMAIWAVLRRPSDRPPDLESQQGFETRMTVSAPGTGRRP
jgi:hypothetical protein